MKNVAVLFSGAKDSAFAVYKAMNMGMNVKFLVTMIPRKHVNCMFNRPNVDWVKLQAEAMGIKLLTKETGRDEKGGMEDLKDILHSIKSEIDGVVSGTIESRYHRTRIDRICRDLGLESISPHWKRSMRDYFQDMITSGFESIVTSVSSEGFDETWLGRRIDLRILQDLGRISEKHGIHKGGEGDEYGSFVLDGPTFSKRIRVIQARKEWDGVKGVYVIENARLEEKDQAT